MAIVFGVHPVREALRSGRPVERVVIAQGAGGARLQEIIDEARERKVPVKIIDTNPLYDFGAPTSIRQMTASGDYSHYFQRADSDYYLKMLEKEILDTLVEFLDARNVDTSDIKERQSTILNNGVIVQGGNIQAGSLAVGEGAKALQSTVKKAMSKAKAAAGGGGGAA